MMGAVFQALRNTKAAVVRVWETLQGHRPRPDLLGQMHLKIRIAAEERLGVHTAPPWGVGQHTWITQEHF